MEHLDKDEYIIRHYYENFTYVENPYLCGLDDGVGPVNCRYVNFGNDDIEYGTYGVNVHSLNGSHSHSLNAGDVIVDAWPLNSYTNSVNAWLYGGVGGYGSRKRADYEMQLQSYTLTDATLYGETFHFVEDPDGNPIDFWYPVAPGETVKFGYTLHIKTDYASTDEVEREFQFSCYPNPSKSALNLEFILTEASPISVEVIDLQGKIVQEIDNENYSVGQQIVNLDVNNLSTGMYTVRLKIGEEYYYEKFIKE